MQSLFAGIVAKTEARCSYSMSPPVAWLLDPCVYTSLDTSAVADDTGAVCAGSSLVVDDATAGVTGSPHLSVDTLAVPAGYAAGLPARRCACETENTGVGGEVATSNATAGASGGSGGSIAVGRGGACACCDTAASAESASAMPASYSPGPEAAELRTAVKPGAAAWLQQLAASIVSAGTTSESAEMSAAGSCRIHCL